jgi:hypothetical protein
MDNRIVQLLEQLGRKYSHKRCKETALMWEYIVKTAKTNHKDCEKHNEM